MIPFCNLVLIVFPNSSEVMSILVERYEVDLVGWFDVFGAGGV